MEGLLAPIADDVVSYEHTAPLELRGVDALREVCQRNLAASGPEVQWEVPELTILVREDLAVGWGLDRVRITQPDGRTVDSWSRGTRIFQRRNGSWQLVHQHLSMPQEPHHLSP